MGLKSFELTERTSPLLGYSFPQTSFVHQGKRYTLFRTGGFKTKKEAIETAEAANQPNPYEVVKWRSRWYVYWVQDSGGDRQ